MLEGDAPGGQATPPRAVGVTLALGFVGGLALGAAGRLWMRLVSDEPEMTVAGTGFILGGFALFGLAHAAVVAGRDRQLRRGPLAALRTLGIAFTLPLFVAAGAIMAPTVVGGSLARTRVGWPRWARVLCAVVAAAPVVLVSADLVGTFGLVRALLGIVGLLVLYAGIIAIASPTFGPPATTTLRSLGGAGRSEPDTGGRT